MKIEVTSLHFIDLKYKGIKIQQGWRNLLQKWFMALFFLPFVVYFLKVLIIDWHWSLFQGNSITPTMLLKLVGQSFGIGFLVLVFALVLLVPLWDYLANLQRICLMIYTGQFYILNDIETPNMMQSKKTSVTKDVSYFPSFYYRMKKGMIEITVRLDGSKFHRSGDFVNLSETLEQLYSLSVVDMEERNGYFTYRLLKDASKHRLSIEDIFPNGYEIPLMKHITWNIAKVPHALINGGTGGGKTFFLNILLRGFAKMSADIRICDPKNSSLADYKMVMPNVVKETESILKMVHSVVEEMDARYIEIKEQPNYISGQDFTHYNLPPLVLLVDEYVAFLDSLEKKKKDAFKADINQIVLKGREAGVLLVLATQRPDAEYLSGNARDQLGLRVTLGKMSKDGYRMTFGATEQKLRNKKIKGRGYIYVDGDNFIQEFYSPLVPDKYNFIEKMAELLNVTPCAFLSSDKNASTDVKEQEAPTGAYRVKRVIFEEDKE